VDTRRREKRKRWSWRSRRNMRRMNKKSGRSRRSGGGRAEMLEYLGLPAGAPQKAIRTAINTRGATGRLPIHRAMYVGKGAGLMQQVHPTLVLLDEGGAKQYDIHWCGPRTDPAGCRSTTPRGTAAARRWSRCCWRSGPWQLQAENGSGRTPLAVAEQIVRPEAIRALLRPPAA
jgi:hypothetical protein